MKFTYVDESGNRDHSDVFVMAGLLVDAYRLRKCTAEFDKMITEFLSKHPSAPKELKTSAFINGAGSWSKVDPNDRKEFLNAICALAAGCANIFAIAFSFDRFNTAAGAGHKQPFGTNYWLGAAMFVASVVQKKMQNEKKNKGLTVFICDDNKQEMPNFSDALYKADSWFDAIYQTSTRKRGNRTWKTVVAENRFDNIINTAFAIKSHHSSLIQVADAVCYVFRRNLELFTENENYEGERNYYIGLVAKLEACRIPLRQTPAGPCISFYKAACHEKWKL